MIYYETLRSYFYLNCIPSLLGYRKIEGETFLNQRINKQFISFLFF